MNKLLQTGKCGSCLKLTNEKVASYLQECDCFKWTEVGDLYCGSCFKLTEWKLFQIDRNRSSFHLTGLGIVSNHKNTSCFDIAEQELLQIYRNEISSS